MGKVKNVMYSEMLPELMEQLPKGAFLTAKWQDKVNTMTIGWGTVGFVWGKPIFMIAVRYSRYTYRLLDNAQEFTVSIPLSNNLKKELGICGSKSGRDMNKFEECGLTIQKGQKISTPVVGECELHYECKVVYQQAMEPKLLHNDIDEKYYKNDDFHVIYYGEIVASYLNDK